jgi:pilus assembly protein CpaF
VLGSYRATGVRPKFLADLISAGVNLPGAYFDPTNQL